MGDLSVTTSRVGLVAARCHLRLFLSNSAGAPILGTLDGAALTPMEAWTDATGNYVFEDLPANADISPANNFWTIDIDAKVRGFEPFTLTFEHTDADEDLEDVIPAVDQNLGSGTRLVDLFDVSIGSPDDGQIPEWDDGPDAWIASDRLNTAHELIEDTAAGANRGRALARGVIPAIGDDGTIVIFGDSHGQWWHDWGGYDFDSWTQRLAFFLMELAGVEPGDGPIVAHHQITDLALVTHDFGYDNRGTGSLLTGATTSPAGWARRLNAGGTAISHAFSAKRVRHVYLPKTGGASVTSAITGGGSSVSDTINSATGAGTWTVYDSGELAQGGPHTLTITNADTGKTFDIFMSYFGDGPLVIPMCHSGWAMTEFLAQTASYDLCRDLEPELIITTLAIGTDCTLSTDDWADLYEAHLDAIEAASPDSAVLLVVPPEFATAVGWAAKVARAKQIARERDLRLVDWTDAVGSPADVTSLFYNDGLGHVNEDGQIAFTDALTMDGLLAGVRRRLAALSRELPIQLYNPTSGTSVKVAISGNDIAVQILDASGNVVGALGLATVFGTQYRTISIGDFVGLVDPAAANILELGSDFIRTSHTPAGNNDIVNKAYADALIAAVIDGQVFTGTVSVSSGGVATEMTNAGFRVLAAPGDTHPTAVAFSFGGIGGFGLGPGGSTAIDWKVQRTSANVAALDSGDKLQQNAAPTTGDDLANKTYVDGRTPASSTTASGVVEIATAAETTTGTDATRCVSPDGLAGSEYGVGVETFQLTDPAGAALTVKDGWAYYRVPQKYNGWNLIRVCAACTTVSSSGLPTFQIANVTDAVDILSTKLTIDANETDSSTAATAAVIDTSKDDVATGDMLRIDCDVAGTGCKGVIVELSFQAP